MGVDVGFDMYDLSDAVDYALILMNQENDIVPPDRRMPILTDISDKLRLSEFARYTTSPGIPDSGYYFLYNGYESHFDYSHKEIYLKPGDVMHPLSYRRAGKGYVLRAQILRFVPDEGWKDFVATTYVYNKNLKNFKEGFKRFTFRNDIEYFKHHVASHTNHFLNLPPI